MPSRCSPWFSKHCHERREVHKVSDERERDAAALMASMVTALSSLKHVAGAQSIGEGLASLDARVAVSDWPMTVAKNLQADWRSWVARPWCCIQLARLRRRLIRVDAPAPDRHDFERLVRILTLVEFGVDVDINWYRRLRIAADEHGLARIRQLTGSPWVWWGPSRSYRWSHMPTNFRRLCAMGRPGHGALHYKRPHRVVAWLLALPALLGCLCLLGAVAHLTRGTGVSSYQLAMAVLLVAKGSILLWSSWWLGPHGLSCIAELLMVLGPEGDVNLD